MDSAIRKYDANCEQPDLDAPLTKGRFSSKVAVVTGGARGIGREVVERFCNDGASVAIFDLNNSLGKALEEKMMSLGMKARFYEVDVTNENQCVEAAKRFADYNGGVIHFLVTCAVTFESIFIPFTELPTEIFKKTMEVNVIGVSNIVQACFPFMKDGTECAVVNMGSVYNHCARINMSGYSAAKGAVMMLSKCMALDLSSHGVRVNTVSPGAVWTTFRTNDPFCKNLMTPRVLIKAAGVASVITFLCSKDAMYIDGADIPVDCGYTAMGPEGPGQ